MKTKTAFIRGMAFFFLVCLALNSCTSGPVDVTKEIAEANKGFMEAFNNGDAVALAKLYTSNAKLLPPNSDVVEGQKAIEEFWDAVMNMGVKKALLKTVMAEGCGAIAIEEGRFKLYDEAGEILDQGKYIVSWAKEKGQWKLSLDIWNSSNPVHQPETP
ncbi:MAG: DUF4440 domain-containing protein [Marinifilaceae bacterium]